jgi:hypothetical protein
VLWIGVIALLRISPGGESLIGKVFICAVTADDALGCSPTAGDDRRKKQRGGAHFTIALVDMVCPLAGGRLARQPIRLRIKDKIRSAAETMLHG